MNDKSIVSTNIEQFIGFELSAEMYGININNTESIERMTQITRVPDSSEHVLGIINLRGDILPVLSLRNMMGLEPKSYDSETRIIVIDTENYRVGIVVDKVVEILNISCSEVQPAKEILTDRESHMYDGVFKTHGSIFMILNVDKILNIENQNHDKVMIDVNDI